MYLLFRHCFAGLEHFFLSINLVFPVACLWEKGGSDNHRNGKGGSFKGVLWFLIFYFLFVFLGFFFHFFLTVLSFTSLTISVK